ncbi:hypothetical protein CH371_06995 [Leptospira wolffii]|uniref:Uncharacterized protein n=1 Tax=Leptospira wolffii TaxID=409998 RepID=A0A2M9ZH25_9LEPT|nr:hypothetical protein CH371_06995 [Leptospira wolffii]
MKLGYFVSLVWFWSQDSPGTTFPDPLLGNLLSFPILFPSITDSISMRLDIYRFPGMFWTQDRFAGRRVEYSLLALHI